MIDQWTESQWLTKKIMHACIHHSIHNKYIIYTHNFM